MIDVVTIDPDGAIRLETIPNGCEPLQQRVGGWIEAVSSEANDVTLWVNEEGKLRGLPVNELATELWHLLSPGMRGFDVLCGTVVVSGGADANGDTMSIPGGLKQVLKTVRHGRTAAWLSTWGAAQ